MKNFTQTLIVAQTPNQVFAAINNVRAWWSGQVTGATDEIGAEFIYSYGEIHRSTQQVVELSEGKRVVWRVTDAHLSFAKDPAEWKGTEIVFDITPHGEETAIRFTHVGLRPEAECYENCSAGWATLLGRNLKRLIETGKQQPDAFAR
jgi:Activator of Hsp90 ATPase homolog 1-like protein